MSLPEVGELGGQHQRRRRGGSLALGPAGLCGTATVLGLFTLRLRAPPAAVGRLRHVPREALGADREGGRGAAALRLTGVGPLQGLLPVPDRVGGVAGGVRRGRKVEEGVVEQLLCVLGHLIRGKGGARAGVLESREGGGGGFKKAPMSVVQPRREGSGRAQYR